ncbi:MAG: collagen-like protein [Sphingobacteriales bacterium]|nr:MAG: collagen-like protein [Sphingobacteriales bacterium]
MKTQRYLFLLAVICLSSVLVKCKKGDDGPVGPAGPKGETGEAGKNGTNGTNGATGATGAAGAAGATGTANVIYSDWITPPAYTKTTVFGTSNFMYEIAASKITQAILDKGTVLVYGKLEGYNQAIWPAGQVSVLPIVISYLVGTTSEIDTWSARSSVGKITLVVTNNNNVYAALSTLHSFRYVIIPGGVHTTSVVNFRNYAEVKKAYNIAD